MHFLFFKEISHVKSELALVEAEVKEERLKSDETSAIKGNEKVTLLCCLFSG